MRFRLFAILWLSLFCALTGSAAPVPSDPARGMPHVVLQIKSIDGLFDDLRYLHGKVKDLPLQQPLPTIDELETARAQPEWQKGIDYAKPWGGYFTFLPEVEKGRPVLLVPVKEEKVFLDMLTRFCEEVSEVEKKGYYHASFQFIFSKIHFYFLFKNGYAFINFQDASALEDAKSLPVPADLMLRDETALAALRFYMEGVPREVKKQAHEILDEIGLLTPEKLGGALMLMMGTMGSTDIRDFSSQMKRVVDESKWASLRLEFDRKSDELSLEFNLVPIKDSALGKQFAAYKPRPSILAGLLDRETAIGGLYSFGSLADLKLDPADFAVAIDGALGEIGLDGTPENVAKLAKAIQDSLTGTAIDLAVALKQAPGKATYTVVGGLRLHETKKLGIALLAYVLTLEKEKRARFKLSVAKLEGDVAVHTFSVPDPDGKIKKLLGESELYFCIKDDLLFAAMGSGALDRLKQCVKLQPKAGPQLLIETNSDSIPGLIRNAVDKEHAERWTKFFPKNEKVRLLSGKVEGGSVLRVRFGTDLIPLTKWILFGSEQK